MRSLLIVVVFSVLGCARSDPKGQWILENYDAESGYGLQKDGIQFRARCYNSTPPNANSLETRQNWERITNGKGPDNSECSEILVYLHKAVPLSQEYGDDRLAYKDERGVLYEFQISGAK